MARSVAPISRYVLKLSEEHRQGIGVLTIIEPDAKPPGADARSALSTMFKTVADGVAISAVVFEGSGFGASLVRSVATGLTLVARQPFPHRVFSGVESAAEWVSEGLPATEAGKATAADIINASSLIRASNASERAKTLLTRRDSVSR